MSTSGALIDSGMQIGFMHLYATDKIPWYSDFWAGPQWAQDLGSWQGPAYSCVMILVGCLYQVRSLSSPFKSVSPSVSHSVSCSLSSLLKSFCCCRLVDHRSSQNERILLAPVSHRISTSTGYTATFIAGGGPRRHSRACEFSVVFSRRFEISGLKSHAGVFKAFLPAFGLI